jgi:pilus assembly protein Flp/PilA
MCHRPRAITRHLKKLAGGSERIFMTLALKPTSPPRGGALGESTESQMKKLFVRLVKDEAGVTAIEYGLIAGLISVTILAAVTLIGGNLNTLFGVIATALVPAS